MPISPYLKNIREKLGHDLLLLPSVSAIVLNDAGHVLLQLSKDVHRWIVPGGMLEPGELPSDAIIREMHEEAGIRVRPTRISGVYTMPVIQYPNGDRATYVITQFVCQLLSGTPHVHDDESLDWRFFPPHDLPKDLRPDARTRIEDALANDPRARFAPPGHTA